MTELVGILNITPDSFSDGGLYLESKLALERARQLFTDGASYVDVGAESTRPGAQPLTANQEWQRLEPILPSLLQEYPGQISLDTYHPETAQRALQLGDVIINDVTGLTSPVMANIVVAAQARCIISHLATTDVQAAHSGKLIDDESQIVTDLLAKVAELTALGYDSRKLILDPGIGFGKTPELNRKLLKFSALLPEYRVMIGYSRKRFLGDSRLELSPNLAAGRVAITSYAAYLRVHDVAGHRQLLYL